MATSIERGARRLSIPAGSLQYYGGVPDDYTLLMTNVGSRTRFIGCIADALVNQQSVVLTYSPICLSGTQLNEHTHTQPLNGPFVRDYLGELAPEETFTHSHPREGRRRIHALTFTHHIKSSSNNTSCLFVHIYVLFINLKKII